MRLRVAWILSIAACGPTFAESHPPPESCEPRTPTADPVQNCALYCDTYLCLDCQTTRDQCEQACVANVTQANPDPCLPKILECVVSRAHEPGLVASLSCADDHTQVFTIVVPTSCPTC